MKIESIQISWSISRGQDTYGYNICRADSHETGTRYRTCGGGYDMIGTVLADCFEAEHQQDLLDLVAKRDLTPYGQTGWMQCKDLYGMTVRNGKVVLDGACGTESIIRIINACGYEVERMSNRKGHTTGFLIVKE